MQGDKVIRSWINRNGTTTMWIDGERSIVDTPLSAQKPPAYFNLRDERIAKMDRECGRALKFGNTLEGL